MMQFVSGHLSVTEAAEVGVRVVRAIGRRIRSAARQLAEAPGFALGAGLRGVYVGAQRLPNLGDQVLYLAVRRLLRPTVALTASFRIADTLSRMSARWYPSGVILGGGTLIKGPGRHREALEGALARFQGARLVTFGTGVEDPRLWKSFGIATDIDGWRRTLEAARFIGVRGPLSKHYLQDAFGIEARVEVIGDPALFFARQSLRPKASRRRIGINLGPSNGFIHGRDEQRVLEQMAAVLKALSAEGWSVTFVPVTHDDVAYMLEAAKISGITGWTMHGRYLDLHSVLDVLERQDVFVGEKLHSVVLAAAVYTPCIMIEYRTKCRDFMMSVGRDRYTQRTDQLTAGWVLDSVRDVYVRIQDEQHELRAAVSAQVERLEQAAVQVAAVLREGDDI